MDGFEKNSNIFVMASTNFPDLMDPALLRAGRFDKILRIPSPSLKGREAIISHYLKKISYEKDVTSSELA